MTSQEAIEQLKSLRDDRESFLNDRYGDEIYITDIRAIDIAIKALEKQLPKKPNIFGDGCDDDGKIIYDMWQCPCCAEDYELDYDDYIYCPKCGQKLDWSEECNK